MGCSVLRLVLYSYYRDPSNELEFHFVCWCFMAELFETRLEYLMAYGGGVITIVLEAGSNRVAPLWFYRLCQRKKNYLNTKLKMCSLASAVFALR